MNDDTPNPGRALALESLDESGREVAVTAALMLAAADIPHDRIAPVLRRFGDASLAELTRANPDRDPADLQLRTLTILKAITEAAPAAYARHALVGAPPPANLH